MTDYACSAGSRSGNNTPGNIDSRNGASIHIACSVANPVPGALPPRLPGNRPTIGLEGIVDGTANVILYGEKRLHVRLLFTNRVDDREGYTGGFDQDTMRYTDKVPKPDRLDAVPGNGDFDNGEWRFGSSHPGGFSVVMCDGAVKSISYNIESADNPIFPDRTNLASNMTLFNKLGVRNDGLPAALQN